MRDLEIRGAGNLLGTQQSGHIAAVGYELYCRLLENAVCGLKNLPPKDPPPVRIDLPGDAWIPRDYIADLRSKIDFYRRISRAAAHTHVNDLETEIEDRFGPLPRAFRRLLDLARLRTASSISIDSISKQPGLLVIGHHDIHCIKKWRRRCTLSGHEVGSLETKLSSCLLMNVLLPIQTNSFRLSKCFSVLNRFALRTTQLSHRPSSSAMFWLTGKEETPFSSDYLRYHREVIFLIKPEAEI